MKSTIVRILSLCLCVCLLCGVALELVACGNSTDQPGNATSVSLNVETEEDDPFADVNYNERPFRIYTSTNVASSGMGNSNYLIQGAEQSDGNLVNDAVVERNMVVEDKLGVKLEFTELDVDYNSVFSRIRVLVSAGTDEYDLVINDLFPFANLSIEGNFRNILSEDCVFDFDKPYWYKDYMDDLRLVDGYEYLLAGDYFIDIIRSAHLLLFNKDMYKEHYQTDPNEVYTWVENYQWTYEKLNQMVTDFYVDKNLDGKVNYGDQFGLSIMEYWGSSIGFVVSANPGFISRDEDGTPYMTLTEGNRANDLVERFTELCQNDSVCVGLTTDGKILQDFTEGLSLVCDYQRLGSLENPILRDMKQDMGVLPYPMLYAEDKQYTTAAHDTTELGAILTTNQDLAFTSTVTEVLCRETARILMPKYYEEALQIQYVNDPYASKMIQIIHDNFRNSFALAYNNITGSHMLNVFSDAVQSNRTFSASYKNYESAVKNSLANTIKKFKRANNIV
ncbi:MAG: hypothetical protein ACI4WV_06360 [Eubacteriales bacterium]